MIAKGHTYHHHKKGLPPRKQLGRQYKWTEDEIRFARANLINKLLKPLGITATDAGTSPGIQLSNGMGKTVICPTIEDVWRQVEIFTGNPYDPLRVN